jgi:hypothetical protein
MAERRLLNSVTKEVKIKHIAVWKRVPSKFPVDTPRAGDEVHGRSYGIDMDFGMSRKVTDSGRQSHACFGRVFLSVKTRTNLAA